MTRPCGPDSASWWGQGRWPRCACGFDPHDNEALTQHWAEAGFKVVDHHGQLRKEPLMREPLKDPDGVPYPAEVQALLPGLDGVIRDESAQGAVRNALIEALESVRSMEHGPNVVLFNRGSAQALNLRADLDYAFDYPWMRIVIDRGELKIKAGAQSWSPPFKSEERA